MLLLAAHRGDTLLSEDQVGRRQTFGRACGAAASRSKLRPARPGALAARPRDLAAAAHSGGAMALHPALHTGRRDRALAIPEDRETLPVQSRCLQIRTFKEDGVLVVPEVFSRDEVAAALNGFHKTMARQFGVDHERLPQTVRA